MYNKKGFNQGFCHTVYKSSEGKGQKSENSNRSRSYEVERPNGKFEVAVTVAATGVRGSRHAFLQPADRLQNPALAETKNNGPHMHSGDQERTAAARACRKIEIVLFKSNAI